MFVDLSAGACCCCRSAAAERMRPSVCAPEVVSCMSRRHCLHITKRSSCMHHLSCMPAPGILSDLSVNRSLGERWKPGDPRICAAVRMPMKACYLVAAFANACVAGSFILQASMIATSDISATLVAEQRTCSPRQSPCKNMLRHIALFSSAHLCASDI